MCSLLRYLVRALYAAGGGPVHWRDVVQPTIDAALAVLVRPLAVALCDLDWPLRLAKTPSDPISGKIQSCPIPVASF